MLYDSGYFDDETCRLEPIENPFGPKVLPMCSEWTELFKRPDAYISLGPVLHVD